MYKKMLLSIAILIFSGCSGKPTYAVSYASSESLRNGVSEQEKKLLSSYDDEVLFHHMGIRITRKGFYPNCEFSESKKKYNNDNRCIRYMTATSQFREEFDLKRFIDDINKNNLKEQRIDFLTKEIEIKKRYPLFKNSKTLSRIELNRLFSENTTLHVKQRILVSHDPDYIKNIKNPNKTLRYLGAVKLRKKLCAQKKPNEDCSYFWSDGACYASCKKFQ